MGHCEITNMGILCFVDTDFKCPSCGELHEESFYYNQLSKSKRGYIYKHCRRCAAKIGITSDYKGDVQVWLKSEENNNLKTE